MPRPRHIIGASRVAALWLLVVSVFFGPAGLAGATGFAGSTTCGASCPCDEAAVDAHQQEPTEHADADPCEGDEHVDSEHEDGEPCQDECPADCPNCGCCVGLAMALIPLSMTSSPATCTSACALAPVDDALASSECGGVFRPPRLLI